MFPPVIVSVVGERTDKLNATTALRAWEQGDRDGLDRLYQNLYEELKRIAHAQRNKWNGQATMNTSVLVNEAYLKLAKLENPKWNDLSHFFAVVAKAVRQILINYAEAQRAQKRGGEQVRVTLDDIELSVGVTFDELLAMEQGLEQLREQDERKARVLECRLFLGMSVQDTASLLDISPATVKREWKFATTWLYRELQKESPPQ